MWFKDGDVVLLPHMSDEVDSQMAKTQIASEQKIWNLSSAFIFR